MGVIKELQKAKLAIDNGTTSDGIDMDAVYTGIVNALNELYKHEYSVKWTSEVEQERDQSKDINRSIKDMDTAILNFTNIVEHYQRGEIMQELLYKHIGLSEYNKHIIWYIVETLYGTRDIK